MTCQRWTDNRIDWDDYNTSTGTPDLLPSTPTLKVIVEGNKTPYSSPRPIWRNIVYRNGKRLKKGEQRLDPFWVSHRTKRVDFVDVLLPKYGVIVTKQLFRMKLCGAYSRKYGKVRKFRKRRSF